MATENNNKTLNVPNKREQSQTCLGYAERKEQSPQGNVPNLRFPEFSGEWTKTKLGDIGTTLIGLTYSPKDVVPSGGIIVLRSSNIKGGLTDYNDIVRVNKKIKESIITRVDDLLICARNGSARLIGKNAILKQEDCGHTFGAFMMVYRAQNNKFVHQLLNTKRYYAQVGENLGARINQITTSDLNSFEFYFPQTLNEQNKIASMLSLLDDRIATQIKIIEKLESLIKGLCQKLTQQDNPNTALNEALVCYSSTLQESSVQEAGDYPVYGATGVCGYTDTPEVDGDSILIIKDGASVGVTYYASGKYSAIGTLNRLVAKRGYSLRYLYYCLKVFNFAPYRTGLAIPHIYFRDYGKAKVWCPSLDEQQRIADALSKVEQKIAIEKSLLEQLYSQKRFLLQAMFI